MVRSARREEALQDRAPPDPRHRAALLVVDAFTMSVLLLAATSVLVGEWDDGRAVLIDIVYAGAALATGLRALWYPAHRATWACFAMGMVLWVPGDLVYFARPDGAGGAATLSDVFWLSAYPCFLAGLALAGRGSPVAARRSVWLDGLLAWMTVAALAAWILTPSVSATAIGSPVEVMVRVAYPVLDTLLLATAAGLAIAGRWRRERSFHLLAAGLALLAVADGLSLAATPSGWEPGAWFDLMWAMAWVLVAMAAAVDRAHVPPAPVNRVVVPTACLLVTTALLVTGNAVALGPTTVALAAASVLLGIVRLAAALGEARAATESRRQANTDELTGLANRRRFYADLTDRLARAPGRPVGLLLLDVDRFKEVNDTLGHQAGDQLLRAVAGRLAGAVRDGDLVARLGGDEFAVVLSAGSGRDEAFVVADRIAASMAPPFAVDGCSLSIGASIGVATHPTDGLDADTLVQHADEAMYRHKSGRAAFGRASVRPALARGVDRAHLLRQAIDEHELVLHFQPKVALHDGAVVGAEALVRWQRPDGLVAPAELVPLALAAGLMRPLTLAVLDGALTQCRCWRDDGRPLAVSVNLSAVDLIDGRLVSDVADALARHPVPAGALVLEVPDGAVLAEPDRIVAVLGALRELGVRMSLDDLRPGGIALADLARLPLDEVKVDTDDALAVASGPGPAFLREVAAAATALGLWTVTEGIEREAQLEVVRSLGFDEAQGFAVCPPLPAPELDAWMLDRRLPAWSAPVAVAALAARRPPVVTPPPPWGLAGS